MAAKKRLGSACVWGDSGRFWLWARHEQGWSPGEDRVEGSRRAEIATQSATRRSQPVTRCCDSRLRCRWQRDGDARARWRVQRAVRNCGEWHLHAVAQHTVNHLGSRPYLFNRVLPDERHVTGQRYGIAIVDTDRVCAGHLDLHRVSVIECTRCGLALR